MSEKGMGGAQTTLAGRGARGRLLHRLPVAIESTERAVRGVDPRSPPSAPREAIMKLLGQPLLFALFLLGSYLIMFRYHNQFSLLLWVMFGVVVAAIAAHLHKKEQGDGR